MNEPTRCACGSYAIELPTTSDIAAVPRKYRRFVTPGDPTTVLETNCGHTTRSHFAQGHDARLKGLLRHAHLHGLTVQVRNAGATRTVTAAQAAAPYGFAATVTAPPTKPTAASQPNPKPAAPKPAKAPTGKRTLRAKVGRWEYDGWLDAGDEFVYTSRDGKTLRTFQWSAIDAPTPT